MSLPRPATASLAGVDAADDVPSRLVENLFWLGRYTVRCADNARLLRSTVRVRVDRGVWIHAVRICRALGVIAKHPEPTARP